MIVAGLGFTTFQNGSSLKQITRKHQEGKEGQGPVACLVSGDDRDSRRPGAGMAPIHIQVGASVVFPAIVWARLLRSGAEYPGRPPGKQRRARPLPKQPRRRPRPSSVCA